MSKNIAIAWTRKKKKFVTKWRLFEKKKKFVFALFIIKFKIFFKIVKIKIFT